MPAGWSNADAATLAASVTLSPVLPVGLHFVPEMLCQQQQSLFMPEIEQTQQSNASCSSVPAGLENWPGWSNRPSYGTPGGISPPILDWPGWQVLPESVDMPNTDRLPAAGIFGDCIVSITDVSIDEPAPVLMCITDVSITDTKDLNVDTEQTHIVTDVSMDQPAPAIITQVSVTDTADPDSDKEQKNFVLPKHTLSLTSDNLATITVSAIIPTDTLALLNKGRQYWQTVHDVMSPGDTIAAVVQNQGDSSASSSLEITVPVGAKPGDILRFKHCDQMHDVPVPEGVKAGDQFMTDVLPPSRVLPANKISIATDAIHDPLAMHADHAGNLAHSVASDSLPKEEVKDWSEFLSPHKKKQPAGVVQKNQRGALQRCAPPPPLISGDLKPPLLQPLLQQLAPVHSMSTAMTFGVGLQFEFNASSGTLCKFGSFFCGCVL